MRLTSKRHTPAKLIALDALRGTAALAITWYHSRSDLWIGFKAIHEDPSSYSAFNRAISYLSLPVSQAGSMVIVFFILSGFCIHLPQTNKHRDFNLKSYAIRRLVRIYPSYAIIVLVCLFMALSLFRPVAGSSEELSIYGASFAMMQNWLYQGKQIALNGSLWTIPIEVEAYIIYPILLLMWRRFGSSSALLLSLVAMLISTILFVNGFSNIKFSFLPYMTVWLAGAWIAEGYAHNRLPKWKGVYLLFMLPATLLLVSAGLIGLDSFWLIYGWGFVAFFTLLWVVGTSQERFNAKNTFIKQLASLGSISYSIYLIHVPVFKVLALIWVKNIGHKPISFIIPTVATLLTIPIAHAFYHFVEKPSHELAKQLGKV